jgi:hypothetical protein
LWTESIIIIIIIIIIIMLSTLCLAWGVRPSCRDEAVYQDNLYLGEEEVGVGVFGSD